MWGAAKAIRIRVDVRILDGFGCHQFMRGLWAPILPLLAMLVPSAPDIAINRITIPIIRQKNQHD
jgi:hypothetical protein